jgi:hypothetical protein
MRTIKKQETPYILVFLILVLPIINQPLLTQQTTTLEQNNPTNSLTTTSPFNITYTSTLLNSNMTSLEVVVLSPKNTTYPDTDLVLSCQINKEATKTSYILDGVENITFTGDIILTDLSPGSHQLIVYAQDQTGTTKASEPIIFTIKPHPSTLVIISLSLVGIVGLTLIIKAIKQK